MRSLSLLLVPLLLAGCGGEPGNDVPPAPTPAAESSPVLPSPSTTKDAPGAAAVVPHEDQGVLRRGPVRTRTATCVLDAEPDFSFDGTVTAIDDGEVTFEVTESFGGDLPASYAVEMGAPVAGRASETGPSYAVGTRMLVDGSRGVAWGCGRTVYWDEETAADRRS